MRTIQCYLLLCICLAGFCQVVVGLCPALTTPDNGRLSLSSLAEGAFAAYTCNDGYSMDGINYQKCQADDTWSNSPPMCNITDCGNASLPFNGGTNYSSTTYGLLATYYCNEGYNLSGHTNASCEASGSWSDAPPSCTIVDCGNASLPTNGGTNHSSTTYGSQAYYYCDVGYNLSGPTNTSCQASGSWSDAPPNCTIVDCGNASLPANGGVNHSNTIFGSMAAYYCNEGYELSGSTNTSCETSGSWSSGAPNCTIVDCGNASLPTYGGTNHSSTIYGSQADYYCNEGYNLSGPTNALCESSSSWSSMPPNCTIVDCGELQASANGYVNFDTGTEFGMAASYTCETGYNLTGGDNVRFCGSDGNWTSTAPKCVTVDCGNASSPTNGGTNHSSTTYGSLADYYCNEGYDLIGSTNTSCQESGSWGSALPNCTIVDCGNATLPTNGGTNHSSTTYGSQAEYYCHVGYNLSGSTSAKCESTGSWSSMPPNCTIVDCGNASLPTDGGTNHSSTTYGSLVDYYCNEGYDLSGSNNASCNASGSWSAAPPSCNIVDCDNASLPTNGGTNHSSTTYGSQAYYYCDVGYNLSGPTNTSCQASGSWSDAPPNCTIVDCDNATLPTNGGTNHSSTSYGSQVDYYCHVGYNLSGSTNAKCESNGSWSSVPPNCTIVDCGNASLPTDGGTNHSSTTYGSLVDYYCNEGYDLSGSNNASCDASGSWSAAPPSCNIVDCDNASLPTNGGTNHSSTTYGSQAYYYCDVGYNLSGPTNTSCQASGSWSDAPHNCTIVDCGNAILPTNGGTNHSSTSYGSQVDYYCHVGYNLSGSTNAKCESTGSWSSVPPNCTIVDCGNASLPTDGGTNHSSTTYGSLVDYYCNEGYDLSGSNNASCDASGSWSAAPPSCNIVDCDNASLPTNGGTNHSSTTYGSQAYYYCDVGYNLSGPTNTSCQASGSWSDAPPNCTIVDCGNATLPTNGGTNLSSTSYGSQVDYYCHVGYNLSGSTNAKCESTGSWSSVPPNCTIVDCGNASLPTDGGTNHSSTTYGSLVDYNCNEGYDLSGSNNASCNASGSWSAAPPSCNIVDCYNASLPTNGGTNHSSTTYGSQAYYYCDVGYNLSGPTNTSCQAYGSWSDAPPNCTIVDCGNATLPTNGGTNHSSTSYGSQVDYYCHVGYNLSGSTNAKCESTGSWSSVPPNCTIVDCGNTSLPTNGGTNHSSTTYGSQAEYYCDEGYNLSGSTNASCEASGSWSSGQPNCTIVDCGNASLPTDGGTYHSSTTYGSLAKYFCDEGYDLSGPTNASCEASGSWSTGPPNCTIVYCGNASLPTNGGTNHSSTSYGSQADYYCHEGYELSGSTNAKCESSGSWSAAPPNCTIVDCGRVQASAKGSVNFDAGTEFGMAASYTCETGYNLTGGDNVRFCGSDGNWTSTAPQCVTVDCGMLESPTDGKIVYSSNSTVYQAVAEYICDTGFYNVNGSTERVCLENGTWNGTDSACAIYTCPPLSGLDNGYTNGSGNAFGSIFTYHCDEGYDLSILNSTIVCGEGAWDPSPPVCVIKDCGAINNSIADGAVNQTGTEYGDVSIYTCDNLFMIEPGITSCIINCTAAGTWDGIAPTCVQTDCGDLSPPQNGQVNTQPGTEYDKVAAYTCNDGYILQSSNIRRCQANGLWDGTEPSCQIVECGNLTSPTDGSVNISSGTTYLQKALYSCNLGFENVSGSLTRLCKEDGLWDGLPPVCQRKVCGALSNVTNGNLNQSGIEYEDTAQYTCEVGYFIMPGITSVVLYCNETGVWNDTVPDCIPVDCGDLSAPYGGQIQYYNTSYEIIASYTCNPGYYSTDVNFRQCGADGFWTNIPLVCNIKDCGQLTDPTNGNVTVTLTTYGEYAFYDCITGYHITSGSSVVFCNTDGNWNDTEPACELWDCGSLSSNITFGSLSIGNTTYGETAEYTCDTGYWITGTNVSDFTLSCLDGGTWSDVPQNCTEVDCGPLTNPTNGEVIVTLTTYREYASYNCSIGYHIKSGFSVTFCGDDGNWNATEPVCEIWDCGQLNSPSNGLVDTSLGTTYMQIANYTCMLGYELQGQDSSQCQADGSWSEVTPSCVIYDCGSLSSNITFGSLSISNTTYGETAKYTCDTGYRITGTNVSDITLSCMEGGIWSDVPPTCTIVDCGPLTNPTNGEVTVTLTTYKEYASYNCSTGYHITSGFAIRYCGDDANWNATEPVCEIWDCGQLNSPSNGLVDTSLGTTYMQMANYTCLLGYELQGQNSSQCQADGTWSEVPPSCVIYDCGSLPNIPFGALNISGTTYNETAAYTCNVGYVLAETSDNEFTLLCLLGGEWSGLPPNCTLVDCGPLEAPVNGDVDTTQGTTYLQYAAFTCETGYMPVGSNVRQCQADGTWSHDQPSCVIFDCGDIETANNSMVFVNVTTYTATAAYTCNKGYHPTSGDMERTCVHGGSWNGTTPTCTMYDCGPLGVLQNGEILGNSTLYSDSVTYQCNRGYVIQGTGEMLVKSVCQDGGSWSVEPVCEFVDCGILDNPLSGRAFTVNGTGLGDVATYTCFPWFELKNYVPRVCQANGQWSNEEPVCNSVLPPRDTDCGFRHEDLVIGLGISGTTSSVEFGIMKHIVKYIISKSDIASDDMRVGVFVFTDTVHHRVTLTEYNSTDLYNTALDAMPYIEYAGPSVLSTGLTASLNMFDTSDGNRPDIPDYAFIVLDDFTLTTNAVPLIIEGSARGILLELIAVEFNPDRWEEISSSTTADVIPFNSFSELYMLSLFHDKSCDCGIPYAPLNGNVSVTGSFYMDTASFSCAEGFKLVGSNVIICRYGGIWNSITPLCIREGIDFPPPLPCGFVDVDIVMAIAVSRMTDAQDFHIFKALVMTFIERSAVDQQLVKFGFFVFDTSVQDNVIDLSDYYKQQYLLNSINNIPYAPSFGPSRLVKALNQILIMSNNRPVHRKHIRLQVHIILDDDVNLEGSEQVVKELHDKDVDLYFIAIGFTQTDSLKRLGVSEVRVLSFESTMNLFTTLQILFKAEGCDCDEPPNLKNGDVFYNGTHFLDVAHFYCHDGFHLVGPEEIHCQLGGVWNQIPPKCLAEELHEKDGCGFTVADVIIAMGVSGDMSESDYYSMQESASKLIQRTAMAGDLIQTGLFVFDNAVVRSSIVDLNTIDDRRDLTLAYNNTRHSSASGPSVLNVALEQIVDMWSTSSYRQIDVPLVAIIFVDDNVSLTDASVFAEVLNKINAMVIINAVGYDSTNLTGFAIGFNNTVINMWPSFKDIDSSAILDSMICVLPPSIDKICGFRNLDVVFALGVSNTTDENDFEAMKNVVRNAIRVMDVESQSTQISGIVFDTVVRYTSRLQAFTTRSDKHALLDKFQYEPSTANSTLLVGLTAALQTFNNETNNPTAADMLYIIMDGSTDLDMDTFSLLHVIKSKVHVDFIFVDFEDKETLHKFGHTIEFEDFEELQKNAFSWYRDPSCYCDTITEIDNGTVSMGERSFLDTASFVCNPGFELSGPQQIQCLNGGHWSGPPPVCVTKAVTRNVGMVVHLNMSSSPDLNNSRTYITYMEALKAMLELHFGASRNNTRIQIVINNIRTGSLIISFNVTIPNEIESVESLAEASAELAKGVAVEVLNESLSADQLILESNQVDLVSLSLLDATCIIFIEVNGPCDAGYVCQLVNGPLPGCLPDPNTDCGFPGIFLSGSLDFTNGTLYGNKAVYTCYLGYRLVGNNTRYCFPDSMWHPEPPICEIIDCGILQAPDNGNVSIQEGTTFGQTASFTCDTGYLPVGSLILSCSESGSWDSDPPFCQSVVEFCGLLSSPENGFIEFSNNSQLNSVASYGCIRGYRLAGQITRICSLSTSWEPQLTTTCILRDCGSLNSPENGFIDLNSTTYGQTATFSCKPGYYTVGERLLSCTENGNWSSDPPTCHLLSTFCGGLLDPQSGRSNISVVSSTELGAVFDCYTGYKLAGPKSRTCYMTGSWLPDEMTTCTLHDCGILLNPNNGNVDQSSGTTYGQVVQYSCIAGYKLFGENQAICNADGQWSHEPPVCQVTNCGGLLNPTNGMVTAEVTTFGQIATYSCGPGYELSGFNQRICQTDGTWSGRQPTCVPKDCGTLFAPINGFVDMGDGTMFGNTVTYSCKDGYVLSGPRESTCSETGVWDPATAPKCEPIDCQTLPPPEHGQIEMSQGTSFGSIATYSCNAGYQMSGTNTRECTAKGVWSLAIQFSCTIIDCGPLPELENGEVLYTSNNTDFGSSANFLCNLGYRLSLNNLFTTQCTALGAWDLLTMPKCTIIDCGQPPTVANGNMEYNSTTYGSSVEYICNSGYELRTIESNTCTVIGVWTAAPACNKIDCGTITSPLFGSVSVSDGTLYESVATITCNTGYLLNGPDSKTCSDSGVWQPSQTTSCSIWDCGLLLDPENGQVDLSSGTTYGQTANFSCNDGYFRFGFEQVSCTDDGTWSAPSPVCQITDCGGLQNPTNGRVTVGQTTLSQIATYSCNSGYTLQGTSQRTCQVNGSWSGDSATCEAKDCGSLDDPAHGQVVNSGGTLYGSSVEYQCDTGYQLSGRAVRSCLDSGQWSDVPPTCELKDCGQWPVIKHGQAGNAGGTTYGSTVMYECNSGYEIIRNLLINCLDTAEWSSPPECRIKECVGLEDPDNGEVNVLGTNFGDSALYQCNVGYQISGRPIRQCQNDGLWSGNAPTCTIVGCESLSPPVNGFVEISSGTEYKNFIVFECDPLHEKSGLSAVVCRADGTWSGQPPTCKLKDGYLSLKMEIQLNMTVPQGLSFDDNSTYQLYLGEVRREMSGHYTKQMKDTDVEVIVKSLQLGSLTVKYVVVIPDDEASKQQFSLASQKLAQASTIVLFNQVLPVTVMTIGDNGVNIAALPFESLACALFLHASGPCAQGYICTVDSGVPVCSADPNTDCGVPVRPFNGVINYERGTLLGDVVMYSCNTGYSLVGDNTLICQPSGGWAPAVPYCIIKDCGSVNKPLDGSIQISGTTYGKTASFTCDPSYSLIGLASIVCQADGTWSSAPPECKLTGCGGLTNPDNGKVVVTDNGQTAVYSCNTGYILSTSGIRTCLSSNVWSGLPPSCQVVVCGALTNPANGRVVYTDTSFGSTATYSCVTEGYQVNGLLSRNCGGDGLWTGNAPVCDLVDCGQLLPITNGNLQLTGTSFGQTGTYSCNPDYILQGTRVLSCLVSGWSKAPPTCIPLGNCGTLNNPTNGYVTLSLGSQLGSTATYACYTGYRLSGTNTRTCLADNSWSGFPLSCILIDCGQLTIPAGGRLDFVSGTTYSKIANYTCNIGYYLFGPSYTVCQYDGTWSNIPTCRIKDCGSLVDPIHGRVDTVAGTTFGSTASYICNTGYYMQGTSNSRCLETGSWDTVAPTCLIKDCGPLINPVEGNVSFASGTTYGQTAIYICNAGYSLSGSPTTQCTDNGVWAGTPPTCVPIVCGLLLNPTNGTVVYSTGRGVGSVATYRCDVHSHLNPPQLNKTCMENGTWSNADIPTCTYIDCGILLVPLFGDVTVDSQGHTATYTCNLGYMLSGEKTKRCENNQWMGPKPICVLTDCGTLSDPVNGKVRLSEGSGYGADAIFECDTGYTLDGYYKRTCFSNGSWSGNSVSCKSSSDYALAVGLGVGVSGFVILVLIIIAIIFVLHKRERHLHHSKKSPSRRELVVTSSYWIPTIPRKTNTRSTIYLPHYSSGAYHDSHSDITELNATWKSRKAEYDNNPLFYSMNMPRDEHYTYYPR